MGSKELVRKAIEFRGPERIPVSYPYDLRISDIVNVEVVRNYLGPDGSLSEWGFEWEKLDGALTMGQPKVQVIAEWPDLDTYRAPDPSEPSRFDAMRKTRAELGDDKYYKANFVLSGFGIMTSLRGFAPLMEDLYLDRDEVERLADVVFGFEEEVIRRLKPQGFDAVGLADDWGSQESLFISPDLWREIFKPRYKRQIDLAHEQGLDVYFHCCGYIFDIIPDFIEIGLDILNPGQPDINGIERMGKAFSGTMCFACPVSYQTTGIAGSREDIRREAKLLIDSLGDKRGGLIGIVPTDLVGLGADSENPRRMLEAFRSPDRS
jgi:uroporphyrinogen decarboxylase